MSTASSPRASVTLDDKWTVNLGRVLMNGTQALVRVMLAQHAIDADRGLRTAGYVTGYRGSPLGNVDTTLWSIAARLEAAAVKFQPGLNEDIAATAIHGTQQLDAVPQPAYDGVFAAWYGKGPGVDRSGDAFKHGNIAGAHRNGGVLLFYGDDHAGKSSTVAHQSEQALAANLIPSLYPANVQEILDYGLLGIALSRFSGSWVGIKCMNEVAEQTATVDVRLAEFSAAAPLPSAALPPGFHAQASAFNPLREEQLVLEHRLPMVQRFVREHRIDRTLICASQPLLGLVTAGKSYGDVRSALHLLGLDDRRAAAAGISLYKVGCIWPLEPRGIVQFARAQKSVLVVEEKKGFLELQMAAILINQTPRPRLLGKVDEQGGPLLSATLPLDARMIARAIITRLAAFGPLSADLQAHVTAFDAAEGALVPAMPRRTPYFCSGCPHNRSTQIPEGSISLTGIGCHTMANFVRPAQALLPTQMGGEGGNWIGLAPFTHTRHVFQNMGDGTYYHSGILAIRAAVAARTNITFKILYNDAVAMTGGQPVDGPLSVADIAHQVRNEGISTIYVLSDAPRRHRRAAMPSGVVIGHRDTLDSVQRTLRESEGCSILIYEQTCAAEKRRRRKRRTCDDPPKRLFIASAICEGCGDCSVQSSCMSVVPLETPLGRKRAIDQSSCNKDYSCLNGFCPSFITVHGAEPRKPSALRLEESVFAQLPTPPRSALTTDSFNLMVAGIGGTGVITVGALIGMAAHIDGLATSLFDMTGLSQKNGAVFTHVRIGRSPADLRSQRLGHGESDVLLAFDLIAALAPESVLTLSSMRTRAVLNASVAPTVALQFDRDAAVDPAALLASLQRHVSPDGVFTTDASALAAGLLGDTIGANLFMLGMALQLGWLPISLEAIETAVGLNGVAVSFNLTALRLGRLYAVDANQVVALAAGRVPKKAALSDSLTEIIAHRVRHLTDYQGAPLADRYSQLIERVRQGESAAIPGSDRLARTVARNYAQVLAYKDEYEVARLLTSPTLRAELDAAFAPGGRIAFNLAPPLTLARQMNGRPHKREWGSWMMPWLRLLARLRSVRGTFLDPFGWTAERRAERALIQEYEALVERVLSELDAENHARAVNVLSLIGEVRGFGPVKQAALAAYRQRLAMELP